MISRSIMIVEDSLIAAQKLSAMVQELGHRVAKVCRTGEEAVRDYGKVSPDLVTMDITMPDMDGITATVRILESYPRARIIMVTSHGQEQMVLRALDAGALGYVLKPVRKEKLGGMIDQVMGRPLP